MNDSERINEVLRIKGITPAGLARALGVSREQPIYDIQKGKIGISKARAKAIHDAYPDINISWLLTGDGEMISPLNKAHKKLEESSVKLAFSEYVTTAPLISQYAYAGYLSGYADQEYIEQQPTYAASKKFSNGNYVAFEIRGDSMEDGQRHAIYNSDIVLGRELVRDYWKCKIHHPKTFVIVHRTKGIICKEIIGHEVDNGVITCHSFNSEYDDFELNLQDIVQLFYIKEIKREP